MLYLTFVFDDAIRVLSEYGYRLTVSPLPATVYLMQMDVINHYRHALDHYLTVPLDAPFLQHSSLGTPYQKWAYFTNQDFGMLSFAVHNLLRYTSRLFHESEHAALEDQGRYSEMKQAGNAYTHPICLIRLRGQAVGVTVDPAQRLSITPVWMKGSTERVGSWSPGRGPTVYFRIARDADGKEREESIGRDEYENEVLTLRSESIDISDRASLLAVRKRGHEELAELRGLNHRFKHACDDFYRSRPVTEPFENLNASYWI